VKLFLARAWLPFGLFLFFLLQGCASKVDSQITPTALVVRGLNFYFSDTTPNQVTLISTGTGSTQEDAIRSALVSAVGQAMGVLLISEITVLNNQLISELAGTYSSGVVKSYKLKSCLGEARLTCTIEATVTPWGIRSAMFSSSGAVAIDGNNLYGQYATQKESIIQRRKFLEYYFSKINFIGLAPLIRSVEVLPGASDYARLRIRYSIGWNANFREEIISYLKKVEKDTKGDDLRLSLTGTEYRRSQVEMTATDVVLEWGPQRGIFFNEQVIIRTYDQNFTKLLNFYAYQVPLKFKLSPYEFCDEFLPESGILNFAGSRDRWREVILNVTPASLKNIENVSVVGGC
jgi:hypothetical protein